ncbi:Spy/CpxP family protein refolding chaperone [Acidiphilium sp.]|uniref:Spy/CpxP family protein refolding chaperone n=1 Tax=Acidiphilium sp. TaxID=527 RepID=UPI003CFCB43E
MRPSTPRSPVLATLILTAGLGVAIASRPATAATTPPTPAATGVAKMTPATTGVATMTPAQKAMIAHVDANLATLKKSIGVTASEEASWQGFTQVSRSNALNLAALYQARAKTLATMNAVQNMESYAAIAARNADDMNALSAAFHTLYAKLTPAQQKKIDAVFRAHAEAATARHIKKMKHS